MTLWVDRVVNEIMSYYSLPSMSFFSSSSLFHVVDRSLSVYQPQMDNFVKIFQQRQAMDGCGITATLGANDDGQIVGVRVVSQNTCQMSLSGGAVLQGDTVLMETYSVETTAWIQLTAGNAQTFDFQQPINL